MPIATNRKRSPSHSLNERLYHSILPHLTSFQLTYIFLRVRCDTANWGVRYDYEATQFAVVVT